MLLRFLGGGSFIGNGARSGLEEISNIDICSSCDLFAHMVIKSTDFVGSLAKGLQVLEAFSNEQTRLSVSEVAEASGLDRSAARRCLLTLTELGYAEYDGKFFSLTPRVLRLGVGALAAMPLPQIIQPWLDRLSERIGESVSAAILDDTEIVYIARAAQHRVMSVGVMPGSRLPAHCTSMGRVLLGALTEADARDTLARSNLAPRTISSLADIESLLEEIRRVREQGYALVDQEVEIGLRSLAVPIHNKHGETTAAINVGVAAAQRETKELLDLVLPQLKEIQKSVRLLFS